MQRALSIILVIFFIYISVILVTPAHAVEKGYKNVQVSSGYNVIVDEDAEIRQTGGHIVIEDLSTTNSKKIRRLQDEIAKLRAENKELKKNLKKFETQLNDQLADMKSNLADLKTEVQKKR